MTRSISGFWGIVMSHRVASVIAAIGVLKIGSNNIVEFVIEVAWRNTSTFGRTSPALFFTLIPCPAGCASGFIFVCWSILGQVVC